MNGRSGKLAFANERAQLGSNVAGRDEALMIGRGMAEAFIAEG